MLINKIKKVAYPKEHGSWGFLLEPLLLALVIAFTTNGLLICLSAFVIFLAHQPIKILLNFHNFKDLKYYALSFFLFYLLITAVLIGLVLSDTKYELLIPFSAALLIMFGYLLLEINNLGRNLFAEFIAPISITFIALNIVLFDNWSLLKIIAFGIILLSRAIPTVLYVNFKLKFFKGQSVNRSILMLVELLFLLLIIIFAISNYSPYFAIAAILLLIARSFNGLLPENKYEKVKRLGIKEFIFGFLFVIINATGYLLDI